MTPSSSPRWPTNLGGDLFGMRNRPAEVMVDPPEVGGAAEIDGSGSSPDEIQQAVLPEPGPGIEPLGQRQEQGPQGSTSHTTTDQKDLFAFPLVQRILRSERSSEADRLAFGHIVKRIRHPADFHYCKVDLALLAR